MKTFRPVTGILLFVASVLSAAAAFQSAQLLPDNIMPRFPGMLTFEGVTHGRAVIAVSIDATGKVQETLPLAYTHRQFANVSVEALREWRFAPAQQDGEPVPVQMELSFDYTAQGAVITSNITNHFLFDRFDTVGENALTYQPGSAAKIDRAPMRISGAAPKYATAAAKDGVLGRVRVRFYIDEKGSVRQPAVMSVVNPYLAEQAVSAIRDWKFEPVTSRGRPVLILAEQEFDFGGAR